MNHNQFCPSSHLFKMGRANTMSIGVDICEILIHCIRMTPSGGASHYYKIIKHLFYLQKSSILLVEIDNKIICLHLYIFQRNQIKSSKSFDYIIGWVSVRLVVFNATFNNITVISWQSVLLVDETRIPQEKTTDCHKSLTNFIT